MLKADSETNNSAAASMRFVLIKVPMDAPAIDLKHLFKLDSASPNMQARS